ncbi:hypothetical protein P4O66_001935 [Electrophorus voltai]|uniref:Uncharacterized protein n=1 Tax=Electrophorus voltai TaxID=2609070 RepID=A0AAD8ZYP6_9TELE|nr:hypothetical protein P4O66_001935 [Electrophorus voltai]
MTRYRHVCAISDGGVQYRCDAEFGTEHVFPEQDKQNCPGLQKSGVRRRVPVPASARLQSSPPLCAGQTWTAAGSRWLLFVQLAGHLCGKKRTLERNVCLTGRDEQCNGTFFKNFI